MTFTLELPDQYGFVLAAATSTFFVTTAHFIRTAKLRKASGVAYPNAYASQEHADKNPAAHRFNCAQRAHANFTENHTALLGSLLISGLKFPLLAASLGGLWSVARLAYLIGYTSSSGPKGRMVGSTFSFLADAMLKVVAAYTSYAIIMDQ
ncbi:Microsomal glutathione S-transferase 3 [Escovopsis weberi]|uniref:Microsomal glutathione S-transferase 3 n=1 Tax=Escovopsis weberi TaxID=150374 RepID=A0A0M9VS50_ESCWE|nr:Microsomal glutathione S-transferase 3 [Escovopsis weberi]